MSHTYWHRHHRKLWKYPPRCRTLYSAKPRRQAARRAAHLVLKGELDVLWPDERKDCEGSWL